MDPLTPPTVVRFRRRWYLMLVATFLLLLPLSALRAGITLFGISEWEWLLLGLGMLAVWGLLAWSSWRCPACGNRPGDHWRPRYCGHCGVPLLEARGSSGVSRDEWRREEAEWSRQVEIAWAGKRAVGLVVVVITIFIFGIVIGAGEQDWVGAGCAVVAALVGLVLLRWIRQGFEAAGLPPSGRSAAPG